MSNTQRIDDLAQEMNKQKSTTTIETAQTNTPAGPPRENLKTDQKKDRKGRLLASDRSRILGFDRGRAGARALSLVLALAHGGSFERKHKDVGESNRTEGGGVCEAAVR